MVRAIEYILKGLIVLAILAVVAIQAIALPFQAYQIQWLAESDPRQSWAPTTVLIGFVLILFAAQVGIACVWPLLTRVRRGTVFSASSFRWVYGIVVSAFVFSGLSLAMIVFLYRANIVTPGVVVGLLVATLAGIALGLLMLVMKALLKQATEQNVELEQVV